MNKRLRGILQAAEREGLTVRGDSAGGSFDGCAVTVGATHEENSGETVSVRGLLRPALDLGLQLGKHRGSLFGGVVVTGNTDIDGELTVTSDEPARGRVLFDGGLADALAALYRASFELRLDDASCSIYHYVGFDLPEAGWLRGALEGVSRAVHLMEAARSTLPVAGPLTAYEPVFRRLSTDHELALMTSPLVLWSRTGADSRGELGTSIELAAQRTRTRRFRLHACARLETSLAVGLTLHRRGLADELRSAFSEDVRLGDRPFDRRFRITAGRVDRLAAILDAEVRAALQALDEQFGRVTLDDEKLSLEAELADVPPSELPHLLHLVADAARRLARNVVHGGEESPYR
ncbi:MAG: hypothetical protein U0271_44550 [Polyangiaceae bacterium]